MTSSSEGPSDSDASEILARLWQMSLTVLDEAAPAMESLGLSPKTFFLLAAVEQAPFPAELARAMHLPPPTVTYMVKQLESLGYLERKPEPGDLRKFRLIVTGAGAQAISQAQEAAGAVLGRRLGRLDSQEIKAFKLMVGRLAQPADE